MNKKRYLFKRVVAFILVFVICVSGVEFNEVKAAEPEAIPEAILEDEDVKEIERLIMEKNHIKLVLNMLETSEEKERLQKEYEELCQQLEERGVSNCITEDLTYINENGITSYQAAAPDYSGLANKNYDVNTFYQTVNYNGKRYSFYRVIVSDKAGLMQDLSYMYPNSVILNGEIVDENAFMGFLESSVKFAASGIVGLVTPPFVGLSVSALISAIPNFSSSNVIHGRSVLNANSIIIEEAVVYIFGYDDKYDRWIHICSRNSAYITYNLTLTYHDGFKFQNLNKECEILVIPDNGGKSSEELAEFLASIIAGTAKESFLDYVATSCSIYLSNSGKSQATFPLHGKVYPHSI